MNQKEAVYQAIRELKRSDVEAAEKTGTPVTLSKQEKAIVQQKLFEGFRAGKIQYNNELPSDDALLNYVSGLTSNWLRKDKRLNGNTTYSPRRPGSRTGVMPMAMQPGQMVMNPEELKAIQALAAANGGAGVQVIVLRPNSLASTQQVQPVANGEDSSAGK